MDFCYIFLLLLLQSQSSLSYQQYSLNRLCQSERSVAYTNRIYHNEPVTTIELHDSPAMSSILIEHVWNNSSYKRFQHCEFNVKTRSKWTHGRNSGLFVAIRKLKFRKNAMGECIDYVIFEMNGITPTSHKVCDTVLGDEDAHDLKNYFEIPEGFVKIIVHTKSHKLGLNEIEIKLAITAFDDCKGSYKFDCSNYRCISDNLYDDSIINCIPPLCADEPSFYTRCGAKPTYYKPDTQLLAVFAAITLFVFSFAISSHCFNIWRDYHNRFANRAIIEQVAFNRDVEYQAVHAPSAPDDSLAEMQINSENPPSYDTLFKEL